MAQTEQKNQNVKKQFEELQSLLERAMALQTSMVLFEWVMRRWRRRVQQSIPRG